MTRLELEAEIRAALGGRVSDDETVKLTVGGSAYYLVHKWINRAMRRIARKVDFDALKEEDTSLSTSDGVEYVSFGTNWKIIERVRIIDGANSHEVAYRPKSWMDRYYPNPASDSEGKPEYFYGTGKKMYFYPIPDTTYTLHCDVRKWPANLTGDSSEPDFGDDLVDDIIIEFALGFGFATFGEVYKKDADFHFRNGEIMLTEAYSADVYQPAHEPVFEGFVSGNIRGGNALEPGSIPDGTTRPYRWLR